LYLAMFSETQLDIGIDYGCIGGPRFGTTIVVCGDGSEQRNINWTQPLGRWQLGDRIVDRSEIDYLLAFHAARGGAAEGFRFKDWTDYRVMGGAIAVGDGSQTQWQLHKRYAIAGQTVRRPLTKIVTGTVQIYLNGVLQGSGYLVDYNSGRLTFQFPPATGVTITADFEFDVPVRFEQDAINFRFEAHDPELPESLFNLESLSVIELRQIPALQLPPDPIVQSLPETIDLGIDYDTTGGPSFSTEIQATQSGQERRDPNIFASQGRWNLGARMLDQTELDYFIGLFRVCRGRGVGFQYYDYQTEETHDVRFDQDELAIRFDHVEGLYYLPGLQMVKNLPQTAADNFPSSNPANYSGCSPVTPPGGGEWVEYFVYTSPDFNVLKNFTFTASSPAVPATAQIYLVSGTWDTEGGIGSYSTGATTASGIFYNISDGGVPFPGVIYTYGPELLIGTGNSVSGTVIEDENPLFNDTGERAACAATLRFVWS
jgi:uncharacterized protein (TIGR02217 family)